MKNDEPGLEGFLLRTKFATSFNPSLERTMSSDEEKSASMLASTSNTSEDVKEPVAAAPARIAFGENVDDKGAHQATGAGFPRVGTKELRRELTQDDKELAAAGYPISKKNLAEEKHVDIVRHFCVLLVLVLMNRGVDRAPSHPCRPFDENGIEYQRREAVRERGIVRRRGCEATHREWAQSAYSSRQKGPLRVSHPFFPTPPERDAPLPSSADASFAQGAWRKYLESLSSLFNLLLIGAGILLFILLGVDYAANYANVYIGTILIAVAFLNAGIESYQVQKADSILASFLALIPPACTVMRDSTLSSIPAAELVAGDVVLIRMGDKTPAGRSILPRFSHRLLTALVMQICTSLARPLSRSISVR